jgi:Uncharacterized conserved protein
MSRKSDIAKLERIARLIDDSSEIVRRHGSIRAALQDKEGQYALFMCISQIGELLAKVEDEGLVEKLPVKEASAMRNFIVHNYEGVRMRIVEMTIEGDFPRLRATIQGILEVEGQ